MNALLFTVLVTSGFALIALYFVPNGRLYDLLAPLGKRRSSVTSGFAESLRKAGLFNKAPVSVLLGLLALALLIDGAATLFIGVYALPVGPLSVLVGFRYYLHRRERAFISHVLSELPSFLNTVEAIVRGGATPESGYRIAVARSRYLHRYLNSSLGELTAGVSFSEALQNTTERLPLRAWRMFASQIALHNETGGDIAASLSQTINQINTLILLQGSARAKTSGPRQHQKLILVIVSVGLVALYTMQPRGMLLLITSPTGWLFLIPGALLVWAGLKIASTKLRTIDRRLAQ